MYKQTKKKEKTEDNLIKSTDLLSKKPTELPVASASVPVSVSSSPLEKITVSPINLGTTQEYLDEFRENILRRNKSTPIIVEGIGKKLDLPLVDTSKAESIGFNPFFDLSTSIDDYISEKGINV